MIDEKEREIFYRVAMSRRSVREFKEDEIPKSALERILDTGRRAASAANRQPWYFAVARRSEGSPLYRLVFGRGFQNAPVLVVGLADATQAWERKSDGANYARVDVTIALTEMVLAATAEGLGSCWIAAFDVDEARKILGLPDHLDPVAIIALGYPVEQLRIESKKNRKDLSEVVRYGHWKP